jgi:hypothetical protein
MTYQRSAVGKERADGVAMRRKRSWLLEGRLLLLFPGEFTK